jgi:hypothetical protein
MSRVPPTESMIGDGGEKLSELDFCRFSGGIAGHPPIPLPPEDAEFAAVRGAEISAHTNLYT